MVYIEWNELRRLKKETNNSPIVKDRWRGWTDEDGKIDKTPIYGWSVATIFDAFRAVIRDIQEDHPDDWKSGFPPKIIEWYLDEQEKQVLPLPGKGNFVRFPFWMVDDFLQQLTPPELTVLIAFSRFAYFGTGVSKAGMRHGETFVGREKIAETTGLSVASIDRIIKSLVEKEHLQIVRRGKNRVVRMVAYMQEVRDWESQDDEAKDY